MLQNTLAYHYNTLAYKGNKYYLSVLWYGSLPPLNNTPQVGKEDKNKRADLEASLLSFEKLDRASPDLWPEQLPGVALFAASFKSPISNSPPKWMAELENDDIDMLKELGSLTTANLMEKVRGLQNLAYQLGLDESREMTRGKFLNILEKAKK
ncbi:protein lin-52 homolog [Bombina bombina]|uniref:protein lin-52 homolog n=1 Tax=Bombina bombina TaxID=8345 RepID=UPI00235B18E7|nr:protein lin-52 homolog [Bombina bombina]